MHSHAQTMTTGEVAEALALSIHHFYRKRAKLEAEGFPRPLPTFASRWSRAQVSAWIAGGGRAPAQAETVGDYVAEHRRYLEAKYEGARA